MQLGNEDKLPRFTVQSDDLGRVQPLLGALSMGDERGVAARLEALEASHRQGMDLSMSVASVRGRVRICQGMDEMKRLVNSVVKSAGVPAATAPVVTVTPVPTFAAAVSAGGGVAGAGTAGGRARQAGQLQPFLNRGRQQGAGKAGQVQQARQDRSSSAGKRQRVDQKGG